MLTIAVIVVFLLSAALASGSILVTAALRSSFKTTLFDTLLYYQIFYFTYGFYAIWGQIIVYIFLFSALSPQLFLKTTNILVLIGSPFMLLSWFMLIRFCREISGRKQNPLFILLLMSGNVLLVSCAGFLTVRHFSIPLFSIIKYCFVLLNLIFTVACMVYLFDHFSGKSILRKRDLKIIALAEMLFGIMLSALLLMYDKNPYIGLVFILLFFLSGTFIPLYINYRAEVSVMPVKLPVQMAFEEFCDRFEISNREREIIREICNGLSNQQIADKLFISLQTVKDHTSRIYSKTNCNSRAMLIALIRPTLL